MIPATNLRDNLRRLVNDHVDSLDLIRRIVDGTLPINKLQHVARVLYAEARASLQVKIPERIRICPLEAVDVRRLWWHLLEEESGHFVTDHDHASLLLPVCRSLGIAPAELDAEYSRHLLGLEELRKTPTSAVTTVMELAQTFVDESVLARKATLVAESLASNYSVSQADLFYFQLHSTVDVEHSDQVLNVLASYAASQGLDDVAVNRVEICLAEFPVWLGAE